jgi:hypothetical protein
MSRLVPYVGGAAAAVALAGVVTALVLGGQPGDAAPAPAEASAPVPAGPAFSADLKVSPRTAKPGEPLSARVQVRGCRTPNPTVDLAARYTDAEGDPVDLRLTATLTGGVLDVPGFRVLEDAARTTLSDNKLELTATVTCLDDPVANTTAKDGITVADLPAPRISLSRGSAHPGDRVGYRLTGCAGGLAYADLYDGEDDDTEIDIDSAHDSDHGRTVTGSFVVPADAAAGIGAVTVDCVQAAYEETELRILGRGGGAGPTTPPDDDQPALPATWRVAGPRAPYSGLRIVTWSMPASR